MVRARTGFDAVLLKDGTIIAVGDDNACLPGPAEPGSERAERYDLATDAWTAVASLNKPRKTFATVALADGRALVLGGINPDDASYSSTKLFDPTTAQWTDGPLLDIARGNPAAVSLADGRVLVASPTRVMETSSTTTTEIYDPKSNRWSNSTPLDGWSIHTLIPLADGRVLAAGDGFETEQVLHAFDPTNEAWEALETPTLFRPAYVPLADGDVLAFGLDENTNGRVPSTHVERFDAATGHWSPVAPMSTAHFAAQFASLADGRVFVAGGTASADEFSGSSLATTEIYDPDADRWTSGPDLLEPRKDGFATQLPDGSILIYGGDDSFNTAGDVPWCPSPKTSAERVYLGA
jgi:hypothetical protein